MSSINCIGGRWLAKLAASGVGLKRLAFGAITLRTRCSPEFEGMPAVARVFNAIRATACVYASGQLMGPNCCGAEPDVSIVMSLPEIVTETFRGTGTPSLRPSSSIAPVAT